jgi:hypothetical protein
MSQPDGPSRPSFSLSALIRLVRWPWRVVRRDPGQPVDVQPVDPERLSRDKLRVQARVVRDALKGEVAAAGPEDRPAKDDADLVYLYRPGHALVQAERLDDVMAFFERRGEEFHGAPERVDEPGPGLVLLRLPQRRDQGDAVLTTLAEIDEVLGRPEGKDQPPIASPDHLVYVTPVKGGLCPATEPEEPKTRRPWPPQAPAGEEPEPADRVRVAVVDTGLWTDAVGSAATPWLESDDIFADPADVEHVNPAAIHPYAGHGTFVAGVISCLAPDTRVEVEGLLTYGGAIYESAIMAQLNDALADDDHPQLISISAGTHTRGGWPLLSFALLAAAHRLAERDDILVVAAAGNDASDEPFWPAAFSWAVGVGSVDPDGAVSDFSNVGEDWVKVYARGRDLVNAFPRGTYTCHEPPNTGQVRHFEGLARWSGTSFSTPVVTGLIAARMRATGEDPRTAWTKVLGDGTSTTDPRGGAITIVGPLT